MPGTSEEEVELAERLLAEWDEGRGTSKSQIEIREWGDATAHGRRFDRFIQRTLGVSTIRPARQTDRISDLERQVRSLGAHPVGVEPTMSEVQLQDSRSACFSALRVWNDPDAKFRTSAFSLLFVTAWNSLALAVLQRDKTEWRRLKGGKPVRRDGMEESLDTAELVALAFPGDKNAGLRENVTFWLDIRNCVAHRHLPVLDISVIPYAQAGLLNFERMIVEEFGEEHQLSERLSVPLHLSGFRDPNLLVSRKRTQAALPLDVQAVLSRAGEVAPELLADDTFLMRVAFIPVVPPSGRNPDAVAYFVRPGEVPAELADSLAHYVVVPKATRGPRPSTGAKEVVAEVQRRIPFRFNTIDHAAVGRYLGVRPPKGNPEGSLDELFCDYVMAAKIYVYNQQWIDRVVVQLSTADGFREATGREPVKVEAGTPEETE